MATSMEEIREILAEMGRSMAESDKRRIETERILAENRAETERIVAESRAEMQRAVREWSSRVGNEIGYIVEVVLVPGITEKMNEHGHNFNRLSIRHVYYRADKKKLAEVDALLENGDETMVVEVKTTLTGDKVLACVEKLKRLRKNENITNLTGKKLFAAVAGLNIAEEARELALSLGMYVVEIYEDKSFISVIKPKVKVGMW
ncbi:MAG: hypothetical protein FWB85_08275 [Chitinispirillia bacterium]|nr:hypothetical protein [Chitinispirillia bacterium]MCL2242254.1 hypothetical protein [Chitinispirillia bacterium]